MKDICSKMKRWFGFIGGLAVCLGSVNGAGIEADTRNSGVAAVAAAEVAASSLIEIVFTPDVPNSVFKSVVIPAGGADAEIFLRDCCIRDDVVEVYVDDCLLGSVDSRGGEDGTHAGETLVISLAEGTHQIEYRNVISRVGGSGWDIYDPPNLLPYTGQHPCGVESIQVVCRPLDSDVGDEQHINSILGRHCYYLVTLYNGIQETYSAFNKSGKLTPAKNEDLGELPAVWGGCNNGDLYCGVRSADCFDVVPAAGSSLEAVLEHLKAKDAAGAEGNYDNVSNNSNLWVKRRIDELGLNIDLPADAITSHDELCDIIPTIQQRLDDCDVSISIKLKIQALFIKLGCLF